VADAIDEELVSLDHKMSQLRREYDQYFLGTRPREPALLRSDVQKVFIKLTNQPIYNTAQKFRFSSLCSRFQAMRRQWDETLRKIEAGTYERHRFKARLHARDRSDDAGEPAPGCAPQRANDDVYQAYLDARLACGQSVKGITRDKLEDLLERQRDQLRARYGEDARFRFRVAVEDGKVRLKAARVGS
jgi:hypothetical protein